MKENPKKNYFTLFIILIILILLSFYILKDNSSEEDFSNQENINSSIFLKQNMEEITLTGFTRPFGINIYNENIYIADFGGRNILIYNKDYNLIKEIKPGIDILKAPHSIDFDVKGNWYVTDFQNKKIQKFSKEGEFLETLVDEAYLKGPATTYFDNNGNLLVSDYASNALLKFTSKGDFIGWIGAKSDGTFTNGWEKNLEKSIGSASPNGFDRLHYALDDSKGDVYVADTWNNRIQKFSEEGKFIGWIGAKSNGTFTNGWEKTGTAIASSEQRGFNTPVALDITNNDELIIFEFNNGRIQKFSKEGKFISVLATGFNQGYDVKFRDNKLYVVDTGNNQIKIINLF